MLPLRVIFGFFAVNPPASTSCWSGRDETAYAWRFCTRRSRIGVVKTHSNWRRQENETVCPRAPALGTATYQSCPRYISQCVHAATALM